MTEVLNFNKLDDAVEYLKDYFNKYPAINHETEGKIYFEKSKYILVLNKFDWSEE